MGRQYDVFQFQQRMVGRDRLFAEDIQSGAGNLIILQGFHQRGFIDNAAPGSIDQDGVRFHLGYLSFIHQVAGLLR